MRMRASLCLALAALAAAQTPTDDAGIVRFTASSQLVVQMVSVRDKNGNPIEGLTAQDFAITESGAPQAVAFCEFQKLDEPEPESAPPAAGQQQVAAAQSAEARYRNRRLLALYFDRMGNAEKYRSRTAARRFIDTQMLPADLVAIMRYDSGAYRLLEDFTDDRNKLKEAVDTLIALDEGNDDAATAFGQDDGEFNVFNTDRQLSALQTAVGALGRINVKKSMIYFAAGAGFNGMRNLAQMRALTNAAIRANVSIYTVDARGLEAQAPMGDASRASSGGIGIYTGASVMQLTTARETSQDALYALAADTGGKALLNNNDLSRGIVQAQKDYASYYSVGYYTTNTALDGKFRRIVVSLKEYPSAKLDYRQGYFGGKEFAKYNAAEKERQLEEALMLGDPVTDITIAMEVNYFQLNRAEYFVPVMLKIPGSELVRAKSGGAVRTVVDFIGEVKDESGRTVQNMRDKVDIKLSDSTVAELSKRPILFDTGFTLLPGAYSIKVLARNNETGRIGTYIGEFVIPNLNKVEKTIATSSVVLSGQRVDMRDALYTAGKDKAQRANPLVQDGQKLIPSVTPVFSKSRELLVYLQAYQQAIAQPHPLVAFVSFFRNQIKVFETKPIEFSEALDRRLNTVPIQISIPLQPLPSGDYECQVTVIDWLGERVAFWQKPILLVP